MSVSWSPKNLFGYYEGCESREIRSFVLSSLTDPRVLSPVYARSGITIIGSQPESPFIEHHYDLRLTNQNYNIGYSFSDGDGKITSIAVNPEAKTMLLSLVTPEESRFMVMMPKELFDYTFIGDTQKAVEFYVFVDGEDAQFDQLVDLDKDTVTYIISNEEGTEEIELRGSLLL